MIHKSIKINKPADVVWNAITQAGQMKQWYFRISNFEAKKGEIFDFIVSISDDEGDHDFRHLFKIIEVVPNKKLKHTWEHPGHSAGTSTLTWELTPQKDSTKVTLTHVGIEDITDEKSKYFNKNSYIASWEHYLQKLKDYLEKD